MKKVAVFLIITSMMLCLSACNANNNKMGENTDVINTNDNGENVESGYLDIDYMSTVLKTEEEFPGISSEKAIYWLDYKNFDSVDKEKVITYDGVEYYCTYDISIRREGQCNYMHFYYPKDDYGEVEFALTDEGIIQSYWNAHLFVESNKDTSREDLSDSEDVIKARGIEIAGKYFDTAKYSIKSCDLSQDAYYVVEFVKTVNKFGTYNQIDVCMSKKGDFCGIFYWNYDSYDDVDTSRINIEKVNKSIDECLIEAYTSKGRLHYASYEISDQRLAYSPEHKLGILSEIKVLKKVSNDGGDTWVDEIKTTYVMTYLE